MVSLYFYLFLCFEREILIIGYYVRRKLNKVTVLKSWLFLPSIHVHFEMGSGVVGLDAMNNAPQIGNV